MDMTGYTKLFGSILASTIWREDDKTRIVWITLLAMANKEGVAEGSIPGLADLARVSIKDCETALEHLMAPDKYSRTKEHEGRRIAPVDGGWAVLNHSKYRGKMNVDERRDYLRKKQQEFRDKQRVNKRSDLSTPSTQSESYSKAESEAGNTPRPPAETSEFKLEEPAPKQKGTPSLTTQFTKLWSEGYLKTLEKEYKHGGAADGVAVARWITNEKEMHSALNVAHQAWAYFKEVGGEKAFWCKQAVTIKAFFAKRMNIEFELTDAMRSEPKAAMTPEQLQNTWEPPTGL